MIERCDGAYMSEGARVSMMFGMEARRFMRILRLSLPIIGGMVSQNVLNLVDTAMVGALGKTGDPREGSVALAAVGLGGMCNFLSCSFILGLGTGVQAMAARRVGEGRHGEVATPLNGGLSLAVAMGLPLSVALFFAVPVLFPFLSSDGEVVREGIPYLQARLCALVGVSINVVFRGHWNATDRSHLYMRTIVFMHVVNIALNWVFIYGNLGAPALGATGAGAASAVSVWCGTVYYVLLALRHSGDEGFLRRMLDREGVKNILRLSIPAGVQQLFFSGGMLAFHYIAGTLGTAQLAATTVIVNLLLVGILPGMGFGLAATSLVGQALGAGDVSGARRWGWDVVRVALVVVGLLAVPGWLIPRSLLSFFVHDQITLSLADAPLRIVSAFLALDAAGVVLMNALFGAGDNQRVMRVAVALQWVLFLPLAYVLGPLAHLGLTAIWSAHVVYRVLQACLFALFWRGRGWEGLKF